MKTKTKKTIDFLIIILVFALTGSSVAYLSGIIMSGLGFKPWTITYVLGYILLIFPLYQGLTLVYAAIFGKFNFFYSRQKKIALKLISLFKRSKKEVSITSETTNP
ncbi:MAG: hypothetical protein K8F36_02700 [Melioribacteraceae bacterium]|nr:hypothetical protein [Melioribacteraceae bacterium]